MSEIVAAIIATAGVVISAALAFLISRNRLRAEREANRLESQTVFLGKLFDARLTAYPALYEILGHLGGKVLDGSVTVETVQETWNAVRGWDRKNALFLSPYSTKTLISLRKVLISLASSSAGALSRTVQKRDLLPVLIDMQMCLKAELGVLHADGFHSPRGRDTLRNLIEDDLSGGIEVARYDSRT